MKKVLKSKNIPEQSIIQFDCKNPDYIDSYFIKKETNASIDQITREAFRSPQWTVNLMKLRNTIVKVFGLKTSDLIANEADYYPIGSRAMAFTVVNRNENEIVMSENDKHLLFYVSVFHDKANSLIYITTIVKFHNIWGKLYFLPVKPFHRLIVKSCTKKLLTSL